MTENRPELAGQARTLLATMKTAALGTLTRRGNSTFPFVTLVQVAPGPQGDIILLLSDLSDHARHLKENPVASLLIDGTGTMAQPLAGPRLTLVGIVRTSPDPAADRQRYLQRFPDAALYADFGDFHYYRLKISEGYFVAGFGRVARMQPSDLSDPSD